LRKHFKSRFPADNVSRLNEVVATDTYFLDTPALNDGIMGHGGTKMVQLFWGCSSLITAFYPMRHENYIAGTLEYFIRHYGAPMHYSVTKQNLKLAVMFRKFFACMKSRISNVNFIISIRTAEQCIQEGKKLSNTLLDPSSSPPSFWIICVQPVVYILNCLSTKGLQWKTLLEAATSQQPDISTILAFHWYEPVYFKHYTSTSATPS
jgi:hypothetical protein